MKQKTTKKNIIVKRKMKRAKIIIKALIHTVKIYTVIAGKLAYTIVYNNNDPGPFISQGMKS